MQQLRQLGCNGALLFRPEQENSSRNYPQIGQLDKRSNLSLQLLTPRLQGRGCSSECSSSGWCRLQQQRQPPTLQALASNPLDTLSWPPRPVDLLLMSGFRLHKLWVDWASMRVDFMAAQWILPLSEVECVDFAAESGIAQPSYCLLRS